MPIKEEFEPYPHQKKAIEQIMKNNGRGLLAITTGGGKTFTSIGAVEALSQQGAANNILVLTPASLQKNFVENLEKFCKDVNINIIESGNGEIKKVATGAPEDLTYNLVSLELFRMTPFKYIENRKGRIDSIICDEIANAKNFETDTAQSLMSVSPYVQNFIGMTADPASNTPAEIVPLMKAVLGKEFEIKNPEEFKEKYMENVVTKNEKGKPMIEKRIKNLKSLKKMFGDSIFYMDKKDIEGKFPEKIQEFVEIPMSKKQKDLYDLSLGNLDKGSIEKLKKGIPLKKGDYDSLLPRIQKARALSISTSPIYKGEKRDIDKILQESPKLQKILTDVQEHLTKNKQGKAVIYSNLIEGGVRPISEALSKMGISHGVFAGKDKFPSRDRQKDLEDYKKGKKKILVVSKAGSEGIDLPDTTGVFVADPAFNPQRTEQAIARGIRLGGQSFRKPSNRKVEVKRYITTLPEDLKGKKNYSIEEWVKRTAKNKSKLTGEFRQFLNQLDTDERIQITPGEGKPAIKPMKKMIGDKKKWEFGLKERKTRSDKGKPRAPYRKRLN